jgi:hypothetical protein
MAGYYSARLLEKRDGGRWVSAEGRERLERLQALRGVVILGPDDTEQAPPGETADPPASGGRNRKDPRT